MCWDISYKYHHQVYIETISVQASDHIHCNRIPQRSFFHAFANGMEYDKSITANITQRNNFGWRCEQQKFFWRRFWKLCKIVASPNNGITHGQSFRSYRSKTIRSQTRYGISFLQIKFQLIHQLTVQSGTSARVLWFSLWMHWRLVRTVASTNCSRSFDSSITRCRRHIWQNIRISTSIEWNLGRI